MIDRPKVPDGDDPSDDDLRRFTAEAQARMGLGAEAKVGGIGGFLPAVAKAVLGVVRVLNPKIWLTDITRFKSQNFHPPPWNDVVRQRANGRKFGDVTAPTLIRVGQLLSWGARGRGMVQIAVVDLAALVPASAETVRRAVRWFEDENLIDTFNVLERVEGVGAGVFRCANLYLPRMPGDEASGRAAVDQFAPVAVAVDPDPVGALAAVVDDAAAVGRRQIARMNARLARWADVFGLVTREWGLNATPMRARSAPS